MLSLAGKFFTSRNPPSIERTEISLQRQWSSHLSGSFMATPFDKDIILFDFEKEGDAKNVLTKGPWNIDGLILVLKEYQTGISLTDNDFSAAYFWIKAEGLPLSHYTLEEAEKIAKRLSDKPLTNRHINHLNRAFWVKVEVDLRQPLKAGFFMGDQRKPHFVQFKYKDLEKFCTVCGKIDHTHCWKPRKERALTRKFRMKTYGPWLRYDYSWIARHSLSSVTFELDLSETKETTETTTYKEEEAEEADEAEEAELLVDLKIGIFYRSEHEWLGKTLHRSVLEKHEKHRFRLPLSRLKTETESNKTMLYEILSSEIEEMAPLVGLRSPEKTDVIEMLLGHLMKKKKKWLSSKRRWVHLIANFTKQINIPIVDIETMLQDQRDNEHHANIKRKISQVIKTRVERNENLLSIPQWTESIKEALREIGVTLVEGELVQRAREASKEAIEIELSWSRGPKPADRRRVEELETVKVLGHEMTSCMICRDDMFLGDKATRMPCSHLFHEECLQAWLNTSNSCPLCRFQLT